MKTAEQIADWLKKRKWCSSFMLQTLAVNDHRTAFRIFHGYCGRGTIAGAFDWECSSEGSDYWVRRHKEFIKWFENEDKK